MRRLKDSVVFVVLVDVSSLLYTEKPWKGTYEYMAGSHFRLTVKKQLQPLTELKFDESPNNDATGRLPGFSTCGWGAWV